MYYRIETNKVYELGKTTSFNIKDIYENDDFGKVLQYHRRKQNIRIKDMTKELNIGYNTILRIEKRKDEDYIITHQSVVIINKIINYLDIKDKIDFSKYEYIDFVLNKQREIIKSLVKKYKRKNLAQKLNVEPDTITRWIKGDTIISKENYFKIKKMLET